MGSSNHRRRIDYRILRFAAVAGFAVAVGACIVCFNTGFRLPLSGASLNSNAVEDLLHLAKVLIFRVIPALAFGLMLLSILLWIHGKESQGVGPWENKNQ
jgi:hypothetical protein